jgi:hypothetical protein
MKNHCMIYFGNKQMNGNSDLLLYFQRFFIYRDGFLERSESVMGGSLFVPSEMTYE